MIKSVQFLITRCKKLLQRKLSLDEVVALLRRAIQVVPDQDDEDRTIYQEQIMSRRGKLLLLRAVVEEDENEIVVVTAYVTTQIRRYWRELR